MKKLFQVAIHEYKRHVFRRRFIFSLLSVPVFFALMGFVVFLLVRMENSSLPVGYVDQADYLDAASPNTRRLILASMIPYIAFDNESDALEALQSGDIQGYYIIYEDYPENSQIQLVAQDHIGAAVQNQFVQIMREQLLAAQPLEIRDRLHYGSSFVVRSLDGTRQMGEGDLLSAMVPMMAGFVFMIGLFFTSGYLMQAILEEKENRTLEMLVTTITPNQLMGGKVLGILAVGSTQLLFWIGLALVLYAFSRMNFQFLGVLTIIPETIVPLAIILVVSFIMVSALMAAIGSIVADAREGQQFSAFIMMPVVIPFWFIAQLMNDPNGALSLGLSIFPLTAPVALTIRSAFTVIPLWQMLLHILTISICALIAVWFTGRVLRIGLLRYGKRLPVRVILGKGSFGQEREVKA